MAEASGVRVQERPRLGWMDGWCEGGLRHQRNDGGGCAKDLKEWRALVHM